MQKSLFDMTVPELKRKAKQAGVRVTKKNGSPKKKAELIKDITRQTGTSNTRADRMRKAKPPRKRRSAAGNVYYEYRKNRSDVPPGLTQDYVPFTYIINDEYNMETAFVLALALGNADLNEAAYNEAFQKNKGLFLNRQVIINAIERQLSTTVNWSLIEKMLIDYYEQ